MNAQHQNIGAGLFWYPYRPWLHWPLRVLGFVGLIIVVAKLVILRHWPDIAGLVGPAWLLTASFEPPQPKPKTPAYFVGAVLAWVAAASTLLFVGFWVFVR